MRFRAARRRERRESIVPMINVVFLLLIFLLLTAEMTPAPPLEVSPPEAEAEAEAPGEWVLHLGADGTLALGDRRGEAALAAVPEGAVVQLRADASLPAAELAALLPRLAHAAEVRLVTVAP
jgi:biopolymer transport protein ExbD